MNIYVIITIGVSYLIGAIPFGYLIGRMYGIDIRKVGSGNIGATNVTRAVGPKAGKICFFLDFLKGALPTLVAQQLSGCPVWLPLVAGMCALLGHTFPIYLKFKGGKGVSTAAGSAIALAPIPLVIAFAIWGVTFFISRYVSLASILASIALPILAYLMKVFNIGSVTARSWYTLGFFIAIGLLSVIRHRENIQRLIAGTENRFERKNKSQTQVEDSKEDK